MYTDLILIRHGETDWNARNIQQGLTDYPLNPNGIVQAEKIANNILISHSDIASKIYTSDLKRAYATAKKTAEVFESAGIFIQKIVTKKDLRPFNWGDLSGTLLSDNKRQEYSEYSKKLKNDFPSRKERWNHPFVPEEGVESLNHLLERTKRAVLEICQEHPGEKVVVFVHNRVITTLIIEAENMNTDQIEKIPNCAGVHFRFDHTNPGHFLKYVKTENFPE